MMDTNADAELCKAQYLKQSGRVAEAYACYLSLLNDFPAFQNDKLLTAEFLECFGLVCEKVTSVNEATELYSQVQLVLPQMCAIHNHIASTYHRLGELDKASACSHAILKFKPHSPSAMENGDNINCQLVDRWHYQMLNDHRRNSAFETAIRGAFRSDRHSILDIGSGTCLLSMMAVGAGFSKVYACDDNSAMFNVARDILQMNNMADKVKLFHEHSSQLAIGTVSEGRDSGFNRVHVIATETVDCGLFGERILSTLSHAWKSLLVENKSVVIPGRAKLYCCVIEADDISLHHRCLEPDISGINLQGITFVDWTSQSENDIPIADLFDPYTTYDLRSLRGGYRNLSEKEMCMDVNFNDPQCVEHMLSGHEQLVEVTVLQPGRMHAIAVWFDLYLNDGISLSSDPDGHASCWHPAIFPLSNLSITDSLVVGGNVLTLKASTANDCLQVSLEAVDRDVSATPHTEHMLPGDHLNHMDHRSHVDHPCHVDHTLSEDRAHRGNRITCTDHADSSNSQTVNSRPPTEMLTPSPVVNLNDKLNGQSAMETEGHQKSTDYKCDCTFCPPSVSLSPSILSDSKFYLDTQDIYRLNDTHHNQEMFRAMEKLKSLRNRFSFSVLDTSSMFSTLPLQACSLGADVSYWLGADNYRESLYKILCYRNNISNAFNVPDVESLSEISLDCVLCDLIEPNGVMRQRVLNDLAYLKLTCLKRKSGVVIPGVLRIWGQCIHSEQLLESNQVVNNLRTCGYQIASHFNRFRVYTQRDIDMSTLEFCPCYLPVQLLVLDLNSSDVDEHGLPQFLNQERILTREELNFSCKESHATNAVVYWFELVMDGTVVSTLNSSSHWRQAATVLALPESSDLKIKVDNIVSRIEDGVLGISVATHSSL